MFQWTTGLIEQSGYAGIAFLMLLENLFPPIPSELIMPMAGYMAGQGRLSLIGVVLAGCLGSVLGALFWYYVGRWVGLERLKRWAGAHGRWLTISPDEVDQARHWFDRYAGVSVFIGRLIPAIRTLISVPAGIGGMNLGAFLAWSSAGTVLWTTFLAGAGYLLGSRFDQVEAWLNPVSNVVIAALVLIYAWRVITFKQPGTH